MSAASKHRGFTLVEMMVVVAIIGVLAGLLLVAMGPAREAARNWQCQHQMIELGKSVSTYATQKDKLPGSFENSPKVDPNTGNFRKWPWVVAVFPYADRQAIWDILYTNPAFDDPVHTGTSTLAFAAQFMCPSDPRVPAGPQLSYVANMGRHDLRGMAYPGTLDSRGTAVFHNRFMIPNPVKLRLDQIKDGKAHTIMLTENVNATVWTWSPPNAPTEATTDEFHVGALWFDSGIAPIEFTPDAIPIGSVPPNPAHAARPSSFHITTFNAVMCDNSIKTISQEIAYPIYVKLMTPDSRTINPTPSNVDPTGVVSDTDLEL